MDLYRHSGAISAPGLLLGLAAGLFTAGVLGVVYSFLIVYIPFIYINPLLTCGYVVALGWVVAWGTKTGKLRNSIVVGLLAFIAGVVGLYVAWGADLLARFNTDVGLAAFHPAVLSDYMAFFYRQGFWSLFGARALSGMLLGAVWVIEAAIIVGGATALAVVFFGRTPFCETCRRWCTAVEGVAKLQVRPSQETVLERVLAGKLDALDELYRAEAKAETYLRLDVSRCETCSASNFLSIRNVVHGVDRDGNSQMSVETLLANLVLHESDLAAVRSAGRRPDVVEPKDTDPPDDSAVGASASPRGAAPSSNA